MSSLPVGRGSVLMRRFPDSDLLGIDNSVQMINRAKKDYPHWHWLQADAAEFQSAVKFDIVFSNAAMQWMPNHGKLLDNFRQLLSPRGVIAFQVPKFNEMPVRDAIERVAKHHRWNTRTAECPAVFTFNGCEYYYNALCRHYKKIDIWETCYFHVMESHRSIIEFVRSAGMKPYFDVLEDAEKNDFESGVYEQIKAVYPVQPDGNVLFPFKRLFCIGYLN